MTLARAASILALAALARNAAVAQAVPERPYRTVQAAAAPFLPVERFGPAWDAPDSLRVAVGPRLITVHGNTARMTERGRARPLRLPLPTDVSVEGLRALLVGNDLVLVIEYGDGESGGANVARLGLDSLTLRWVSKPLGFNMADPLLESPFLYVAAIGTVAKLDLRSGRFVWRHDHLYDGGGSVFDRFRQPVRSGDDIVFRAHREAGAARAIVVRDRMGAMTRR